MGLVAFLLLELSKRQEWCFQGRGLKNQPGHATSLSDYLTTFQS
jgi:hypothetical protein